MIPTAACTSEHYESIIEQNNHIGTEIDLSLIGNSGEGSKACGTKPFVLNPQAWRFMEGSKACGRIPLALNPLAKNFNSLTGNELHYAPLRLTGGGETSFEYLTHLNFRAPAIFAHPNFRAIYFRADL